MLTRAFGPNGPQVPLVGQGTWPVPSVAALRRGIELGMTHIDTAEMYGSGRSEELVGEAIAGMRRDSLFLVSKFLPDNGGKNLTRSCDATLRRLGVDYLDVYLLHWRGSVDLAETMAGLEKLVHAGKVRSLGVSNLDPWDLREAKAALTSVPIACNQVLYNLGERTIEDHELPWSRENDCALVAYTPLGGLPSSGAAAEVLRNIADDRHVTPETVALAFLLADPLVFVIPKASQIEHVEANARAASLTLRPEELAAIDRAFPKTARAGALPMN